MQREGHDYLTIYHEDFVMQPKQQLALICNWLQLDTNQSYIDDSASIVYKNPHMSRNRVEWGVVERNEVEQMIDNWSILSRYAEN